MTQRPDTGASGLNGVRPRAPDQTRARAVFVERMGGRALEPDELLSRVAAAAGSAPRPLGPLLKSALARTRGCGEEGRLAAVLAGLATYGALAAARHHAAPGGVSPAVWGLDLDSGALRVVDAMGVAAPPARGRTFRRPVGAAAGLTWVNAVEAGLAQHCEALLVRRLDEPGTRVTRLDLDAYVGDEGTGHLLRLLKAKGSPRAHDLSALLSLPACAVRIGRAAALATGDTLAAAVRTAAERALGAGPPHAVTGSGPEPFRVAAIAPEQELPPVAASGLVPPTEHQRPLEALRAQGYTSAALLLDHDPRAIDILPYLVHVVLLDA
ncbi:hypothetical protein [Streptomyces sp. x-80]|uniref:hypothetical protein n=1 Tax=Streptomyces sp. x-80 TaxID=2789282 RepID=UPI00397F8AD5